MRTRRRAATPVTFLALAATAAPALTQERFETVSAVPAAQVLPAAALKGPLHEVAAQAQRDGVMLRFEVGSDFGEFEAPSREMALVRVDEVAAIARLDEIGSTEVFAKALAASVEKKAKVVGQAVKDPGGTARGVGRGLKGLWGKAKKSAGEAAEKVSGEGEGGDGSGGDVGSRLLGVDEKARVIAKAVGADPYTSNPRLREELERLARAAAAGGITASFGVRVPGVDTVASASELAWSLPPEDLRKRNEQALDGMGCGGKCQKKLLNNAAWTPSLATRLVDALTGLEAVQDRSKLVDLAATAENEVEARFYCGSMTLLDAAKASGRAQAYGRAPSVLSADGRLVVAAAVDHLAWTADLAEAGGRSVKGAGARELWTSGILTDRARAGLEAAGWALHAETPLG